MASRRRLARAPIQEALIDIQFPATDMTLLNKAAADLVQAEGAKVEDLFETQLQLKITGQGQHETRQSGGPGGKRIEFTSRTQVLQLKRSSFTFSQLPQYDSWEAMSGKALELWKAYRQVVKPQLLRRVAVRYINRLSVPVSCDFDDYLTAGPKIPAALPQAVLEFFSRTSCPRDPDVVIVTQSTDRMSQDGKLLDVLLDIDVYRQVELLPDDHEALCSVLERLRDIKNDVFFEHLTEKAAEMYE